MSDVINVCFFEQGSDEPFVASRMPVDQLPDTFAIDTQLDIGSQKWVVVSAEPAQKSEFAKSGELKITLTQQDTTPMDPKDILFSVPTLNDSIAALEPAASLENVWVCAEDDWRQIEFISTAFAIEAASEIEAIQKILEENKDSSGFKSLHLRKKIESPLAEVSLKRGCIEKSFTIKKTYAGVAFRSTAARVVGGFAWETVSGLVLWGQINKEGNIGALNLAHTQNVEGKAVAEEIEKFLSANGLLLVDWPATYVAGDTESFADYVME